MSTKRQNTAGVIPDELIFMEILTRLPMKCLIQLTLVCKRWYSLISKPGPIHTFLALTSLKNNHNSSSLIVNSTGTPRAEPFGDFSIIRRFNSIFQIDNSVTEFCSRILLEVDSIAKMSEDFAVDPNRCVDIVGSANGLVCLTYIFNLHLYFIWNPLTNLFKIVSKPDRSSSEKYCKMISGFCYDPVDRDFKILDIEMFEMRAELGKPLLRVQVYSCNTNTWKEIRDHALPVLSFGLMCNLESKIYVKFYSNPAVLLAFDAHDEVFRSLPSPNNSINGEIVKYCVNWRDSLGVIVRNEQNDLDVYRLDEGKVKWIKWYTLDNNLKDFSQLLFSFNDDGDVVVMDDMEDMLYVFEPESTIMLKDLVSINPLSWVEVMSYRQSICCVEGMQYLGNGE